MRTNDEILAKMRDENWGDLFGTRQGDLLAWLPFEQAKEWLKPEATKETWDKNGFPRASTDDAVFAEIKGYMPFAWEKANDCRWLSAGRSMYHMQAWLWLLGVDDAEVARLEDYTLYGKPQLRAICEAFGIPWQHLDNGAWRNNEDDSGAGPTDWFKLNIPDHLKAAALA